MADIELNTEWIKVVEQAPKMRDYFVESNGGTAYLGKAPSASRRSKRELKDGDRGKIDVPAGESVFARAESGTLTLSVERDNFSLELFPRKTIDTTSAGTLTVSDAALKNRDAIYTDSITAGSSGTSFASQTVPDGQSVVFRSDPGNSGNVDLGDYRLTPGDAVHLDVSNVDVPVFSGSGSETVRAVVEV